MIGPPVTADRDRMAAPIVGAIDQDATNAHVEHLGKGDLLGAGEGRGWGPLGSAHIRRVGASAIWSLLGGSVGPN